MSRTEPQGQIVHSRRDVLVAAAVAALLGCAIDALIFTFAYPAKAPAPAPETPPSWLIGSVWVLLFGLMGAAWGLLRQKGQQSQIARWCVVFLLLFCSAYPFYTGLFTSGRAELAGNIATIFVALLVAALCYRISRPASVLISLPAVWVLYASSFALRSVHL